MINRNKWRALAVIAALAVTVSAPAQQSTIGGTSSRPRLTSVGVGGAAPAGTGNLTATGTVTANNVTANNNLTVTNVTQLNANGGILAHGNTASSTTNLAFVTLELSDGTDTAFLGDVSSGNATLAIANLVSGAALDLQTTGGGTVQVNGVAVPKFAWFFQSDGAGACTVSATISSRGVSSCTRNSVGTYTVTLNAGYTDEPVCTVSTTGSGNSGTAAVSSTSTTSVAVQTQNNAAALTDKPFNMQCVGI